jgi:hypothetical protein
MRIKIFSYYTGYQKQCPYKQRYIAGDAKRSTKPLSKILSSVFTAVKTVLQKYHDTCFFRSGVYQMWILKKLKRLNGDFKF